MRLNPHNRPNKSQQNIFMRQWLNLRSWTRLQRDQQELPSDTVLQRCAGGRCSTDRSEHQKYCLRSHSLWVCAQWWFSLSVGNMWWLSVQNQRCKRRQRFLKKINLPVPNEGDVQKLRWINEWCWSLWKYLSKTEICSWWRRFFWDTGHYGHKDGWAIHYCSVNKRICLCMGIKW